MKPISKIEGVADDAAIVFYVDKRDDEEEPRLYVENDEEKAKIIFLHYYALFLDPTDNEDTGEGKDEEGEEDGDD